MKRPFTGLFSAHTSTKAINSKYRWQLITVWAWQAAAPTSMKKFNTQSNCLFFRFCISRGGKSPVKAFSYRTSISFHVFDFSKSRILVLSKASHWLMCSLTVSLIRPRVNKLAHPLTLNESGKLLNHRSRPPRSYLASNKGIKINVLMNRGLCSLDSKTFCSWIERASVSWGLLNA